MMGHRQQQQQPRPTTTMDANESSANSATTSSPATASGKNPALDAFNVMTAVRPVKSKNDFGLRQFGDVIGRAKSTLNVIDVWKSKLVSASSAAMARQLSSSGTATGERGLGSGFGSKNKSKTGNSPVLPPSPVAGGVAGAKNEISTGFSSAAAASRIKRRLFRRNKSLDFDTVVTAEDSKLPIAEGPVVTADATGVLCKSVDNILSALVTGGRGGEEDLKCSDQVFKNKGRRRSSASVLLPDTVHRKTPQQQRRRRRCYSYQDEEHEVDTVDRVDLKQQLETTPQSSADEGEEDSVGYKLGRGNVLNNKLVERSYCERARESSKRSLGTKEHDRAGFPILLLDKDFDLDDFYYYYWKKKLKHSGEVDRDASSPTKKPKKQKRDDEEKGIRATLKLKRLPSDPLHLRASGSTGLGQRRLSDPILSTAKESSSARIVEELTDTTTTSSTHTINMLTEDDSSSTATAISALGVPGKPRKKLSFKEPDRGRGTGSDDKHSYQSYYRPRSGSLDSELEVLTRI